MKLPQKSTDTPDAVANATFPVAEIFGPTVQGEGIDQGAACHFVRLGGCDYRCSWCDTPHAVLPAAVRELPRMTADEITYAVGMLPYVPWVILSGGNPAIHNLGPLCDKLSTVGFRIAVETQGSRWNNWLNRVSRLCVSPKPPSSGMTSDTHDDQFRNFMSRVHQRQVDLPYTWAFLKIVVFDEGDLQWAEELMQKWPMYRMFLSTGNDAGTTVGDPDRVDTRDVASVRQDLLDDSRWLVEKVLNTTSRQFRSRVTIQTQYHTLLWGNERGR